MTDKTKTPDFLSASIYASDIAAVKDLGSADALAAFLLLNKWRKFSLNPRFVGRVDGFLEVPKRTREEWGFSVESWWAAVELLEDGGIVRTEHPGPNEQKVCELLTDYPKPPKKYWETTLPRT